MSYEKTTWQNGDTITAEKLNNIENGIAGSIMNVGYVIEDGSAPRLNKTWKEIYDHIALGGIAIMIVIIEDDDTHGRYMEFILSIGSVIDEHESLVYTMTTTTNKVFNTDNENGYPVYMTTDNIGDDHN